MRLRVNIERNDQFLSRGCQQFRQSLFPFLIRPPSSVFQPLADRALGDAEFSRDLFLRQVLSG